MEGRKWPRSYIDPGRCGAVGKLALLLIRMCQAGALVGTLGQMSVRVAHAGIPHHLPEAEPASEFEKHVCAWM